MRNDMKENKSDEKGKFVNKNTMLCYKEDGDIVNRENQCVK